MERRQRGQHDCRQANECRHLERHHSDAPQGEPELARACVPRRVAQREWSVAGLHHVGAHSVGCSGTPRTTTKPTLGAAAMPPLPRLLQTEQYLNLQRELFSKHRNRWTLKERR